MSFYAVGDLIPAGKSAYQLEKQLGRGGMATVFLARRLDLNSLVVIKVLNPELAQASKWVTKSFQAEARVLSQMKSEFLPVVLDFGRTHDQIEAHYYTMERIVGRSLKQVLDFQQAKYGTRGVRIDQAINITGQIARGLAAVHKRGVVHCDLKPANIFLYRTEEGVTRVKIIDFGIMLVLDDQRSRVFVGTPSYAAPEQLLEEPLSTATDIFSLGLILYELLTGTWAYKSSGLEHKEALARARREAPSLEGIDDLPRALAALTARALSLDPAKRMSASSFALDLRTVTRELGPVDRSILSTDPGAFDGRASSEEDERPISIADVNSTDVDANLDALMQEQEQKELARIAYAETEPTAAPKSMNDTTPMAPPFVVVEDAKDEKNAATRAPAKRRPMTVLADPAKRRVQFTDPMAGRPRWPSQLETEPPSRELPAPASDRSGLYVPRPKGETTPMAPLRRHLTVAKAPAHTSRSRRLARRVVKLVNSVASRRFGTLYLLAFSGLLGCLIILGVYVVMKPSTTKSDVQSAQRGSLP